MIAGTIDFTTKTNVVQKLILEHKSDTGEFLHCSQYVPLKFSKF